MSISSFPLPVAIVLYVAAAAVVIFTTDTARPIHVPPLQK